MKNDGGPAFPDVRQDMDGDHMGPVYSVGGMTLRDYFAAAAMQSIVSTHRGSVRADVIVPDAYLIADEMLRERAK